MKIIGTETRRYSNKTFSLYLVDDFDAIYTVNVKKSFWSNSETYKKNIFTNGTIERVSIDKKEEVITAKFNVYNADWLIIVDQDGNWSMYITDQYCGPVIVKKKYVQDAIDNCYEHCRSRIDAKKDFAKEMGAISRRLNLPFHLVLAFKGNEEVLRQMVQKIELAIYNRLYENKYFMEELASTRQSNRMQALSNFGIEDIPGYQAEKIANYIYECLENQRLIRRFE